MEPVVYRHQTDVDEVDTVEVEDVEEEVEFPTTASLI